MAEQQEDRLLVKTLHSTAVDKSHTFAGLSTLKMNKKDRHMRTLREFSVFLEQTNETVVHTGGAVSVEDIPRDDGGDG